MSTRNERERNKKQHDKHLSILMELLREEGNKHCADCRAKGPRWASWNLGIFVCITCAGIHRNLGVHISKVKSVNLDAWTPDQIKNMVEWSNSRAAYHYEYHLPKDFKRPQSDSGLEQFIRNKYEKKLYIKKDGLPSPTETKSVTKPKEKKKTIENSVKKPQELQKTLKVDAPKNKVKNGETKLINKEVRSQNPKQDTLLSLTNQPNAPISQEKREPDTTDDLLNFGSSFSTIPKQEQELTSMSNNDPGYAFNLAQTMAAPKANTNIQIQPSTTNQVVGSTLEDDLLKTDSSTGNQSTKDSIMALYQPSPSTQASQQVFGVPGGVYLQQQQLQQPNISYQSNPQLNNAVTQQFGFQQQQQQQIHQLNQVQQQMAKLGFRQPSPMPTTSLHNGQVVPPNRAGPTSQVMPGPQGYNYTQAPPVYGSAGYAPYGNQGPGAGWMSGGSVPQQQPTLAPYLTTGPPVPAYNMYPNQGVPTSGQTLSTNLWK